MNNRAYNSQYWKEKITAYQKEDWSRLPSPFVQLCDHYFKDDGRVLELGTGAGQDGLWLESKGYTVTMCDGSDSAAASIRAKSKFKTNPVVFDITKPFPFDDNSFDVVYAQLVLHYFNDQEMLEIIEEIERVLVPGGVFACMVNTIEDPEYKELSTDDSGIISTPKLLKRYFSIDTFRPFIKNFESIIFNAEGRTPKDDIVGNSGMIQFVGSKK